MKDFLTRFLLAAAVVLIGFALASSARGQTADPGGNSATSQPQRRTQTPSIPDFQMFSPETQTQDAHAFAGRVAKENGELILKDPVTKVSYQFDDQSKAKRYLGRQVRVTGKLDLNSNTIHIESIKLLS